MYTAQTPVCNLGLFGNHANKFWMGSLHQLPQRYPLLAQPHKHDFYAFLILDRAEGYVHIDGQTVTAGNTMIIIIKPGCINTIALNENAKGTLICFTEEFFSLRYNNNILSQFSYLSTNAVPDIVLAPEQLSHLQKLLEFLLEEFTEERKGSEKVMRSYLNIFLFEVERLYNPLEVAKSHTLKQEKMHLFQKLIDGNFKEKKLPSDYADMLNVSPNYLNKICKEETGQTAGDIIRRHVTTEARRLLHYTNYSVNEIADKLGFGHASYFVTFFKKQTQQTPELFRRSQNA
jgi:AraC-like DNA-binding protein